MANPLDDYTNDDWYRETVAPSAKPRAGHKFESTLADLLAAAEADVEAEADSASDKPWFNSR